MKKRVCLNRWAVGIYLLLFAFSAVLSLAGLIIRKPIFQFINYFFLFLLSLLILLALFRAYQRRSMHPSEESKQRVKNAFKSFLLVYIFLLFLKRVLNFNFGINWLLGIVILFGLLAILFPLEGKESKGKREYASDYIFIYLTSILAMILVYLNTRKIGLASYFASFVSGLLAFIFLWIMFVEPSKSEEIEIKN